MHLPLHSSGNTAVIRKNRNFLRQIGSVVECASTIEPSRALTLEADIHLQSRFATIWIAAYHPLVKNVRLRVVLEPSDEGGYTVYVPSLPGCLSEGENIDDALSNIQEASELYLEPLEDEITFEDGTIVRELVL